MPITIKKPEFKKFDKKYRKWTVATAMFAFTLTVVLFIVLKNISNDTSPAKCILLFSVYSVFSLCSMITLKKGIDSYRMENNMTALFQSMIYGAVIVFCLMNLPFALVLLCEGIGKSETAQKIMGSKSYSEFILGQRTNWMCMLAGMTLAMFMGVLGGRKLAGGG